VLPLRTTTHVDRCVFPLEEDTDISKIIRYYGDSQFMTMVANMISNKEKGFQCRYHRIVFLLSIQDFSIPILVYYKE